MSASDTVGCEIKMVKRKQDVNGNTRLNKQYGSNKTLTEDSLNQIVKES